MHALHVFRQAASVHAPRALQHQFHSATTLAPVGSVDRTQLGMVLNQPCPIVSLGAVSTATVGVVPMRAMSDHREIKYRGSKNYTELRELAQSISSTAPVGTSRRRFLEAIHVHKYNKSYDAMFETLDSLCRGILASRPTVATVRPDELAVLRSFVHHCHNPRYGYHNREAAGTSDTLLADVERFLRRADVARRWRDGRRPSTHTSEGPSWWQSLSYANRLVGKEMRN